MATSKLYRRLKDAPKPLFAISADNNFSDGKIHEITTHHGGNIDGDYAPATATFAHPGLSQVSQNTHVKIALTPEFATWVQQQTKRPINSTIFSGRVGGSEVEDRGASKKQRHTTRITCSSWAALLPKSARRLPANPGHKVNVLIAQAFLHPQLTGKITVSAGSQESYDEIFSPEADLDFSAAVGKYGADIGVCIIQHTSGQVYIRPLEDFARIALDRVSTVPSITESQVLSSSTWAQPIDVPGGPVRIIGTDAAGQPSVLYWEPPTGSQLPFEPIEKDLSYIKQLTPTIARYGSALTWRSNYRRTSLEKVTVRMDYLLSSTNEYDRDVAGYLLSIEHFSVITLSGDWHPSIRGAQVVVSFEHKITADGWLLTLELDTFRNAFGFSDSEIPPVPARLWKQLTSQQWDTESKQWNEY